MALFQILRGKAAKLSSKVFHDGYAYFTPDDGGFYIDAEVDGEQKRIRVNPEPDIPAASITTPKAPGTAAVGTENKYARGDHTHPSDTTKLDKSGDASNTTIAYTEASTTAKLSSGEKLSVAMSKIAKAVSDLIAHLSDTTKHITSTERTTWNGKQAQITATGILQGNGNGSVGTVGTSSGSLVSPAQADIADVETWIFTLEDGSTVSKTIPVIGVS